MSGTSRSFYRAGALALGLAVFGLISSATYAASIASYGNRGPVGPGITFTGFASPPAAPPGGITESSATDTVPLYGSPSAFAVGLDFNPTGFVATSTGGGADLTDGQLNFTINSTLGVPIQGINLYEAGDYSLLGAGGAATQVLAGAILRATITGINGADHAPIAVPTGNGSFQDDLSGGFAITQPWSVSTFVDINAALGPNQRATKVDIVVNNQLFASSEANSTSFIAKKEFIIDVDVPEPTSVVLVGLAVCSVALAARKRS